MTDKVVTIIAAETEKVAHGDTYLHLDIKTEPYGRKYRTICIDSNVASLREAGLREFV